MKYGLMGKIGQAETQGKTGLNILLICCHWEIKNE